MNVVKAVMLLIIGGLCGWTNGYAQSVTRIPITSINPNISTGMNYSPWFNDDVTNLISNVWTSTNMQYVDVKLKLQTKANVSKLSLYDFEGTFESNPATIYAVNGTSRTLIGTFTGSSYLSWVDINVPTPVLADTIIVRKYGNCIPQKIKVFGTPVSSTPPTPTVTLGTAIMGAGSLCQGASAVYTNAAAGGSWSSNNTAVAAISSTGIVTGVAAGTATIAYNKLGAVALKTITVNPLPNAGTIAGASAVCVGAKITLTNTVTGGVWSTSTPSVSTIMGGVVTGMAPGTTTIKYTKVTSCGTAVATKVVTVSPAPTAGTISGASTVAAGATIALGSTVAGGSWTSSAPHVATVSTTGAVTGVSAGSTLIKYSVTNGCGTAVASKTITVTGTAAVSAGTLSGTASVCTGATTAFASTVSGGTWSSSSTAVATVSSTGTVTGIAAGTATISYTKTTTAGTAVATRVVTVNAAPSAGSISGAAAVTTGATTALTASVAGGSWSSSNSAVASVNTAGTVTGVSAGSATISYRVTNACGTATATKSITVSAGTAPSAGTITGTATVCAGATTALSNTTTGGTWSSSTTWVATVSSTGVVTGVNGGTTTISYTVSGAVATRVVTVTAAPSAGTLSGSSAVAVGATTALSSSVSGGTWSSSAPGVASVNTSGMVTGLSAGAATISYRVTNGCGTATATKSVTVSGSTSSGSSGGSGTGTLTHGKIPIEGKRWYQLNNCTNGLGGLFDGNLTTAINTGWGKILTNFDAMYPVKDGEIINIDSVKFYDGAGSNESIPFKLYYIDSNWNRVLIATFIGNQYNMWVGPNASTPGNYALPVPARGVKYLVINCSSAYPYEMELYGSYRAPNAIAAMPARNYKLKNQLGVNAFEWDFLHPSSPLVINETRLNAVKSFSSIRHYLDWEKLEPTNGGYTFNPSHSGGWNMDVIYERCKAEGIEVLVDIKTIPHWMRATYTTGADDENVPVPAGSDFTNPASYIKQAKLGFQFAARYGYNASVSTSLLSVNAATRWTGDPANVVKRGLGLVSYIECDNERDKWWKGRNAYQTGREYAANLSAFYDGHKNTMGPGVGVKNADPAMQVVMGGVAMPTVDYLMGMIDWCKEHRGYRADGSVNLCWDIINYHIYPDNGGSYQGGGTRGAAPEVARIDTFARNFINVAHEHAQGMPVWITEIGYDINQSSVIKAIAIGGKSIKETQADWTLRSSLLHARSGIERTFYYMMDDVDTNSTIKFSSCGLINANFTRKPVADYLYQTKRLMGEYVYKETICTNPMVDRYELDGRSAYVLVKPTENGSTMPYSLSLPFSSGSVKVYKPTIGQDSMSVTSSSVSGGSVSLTVTETPIFVIPTATAARMAGETETTVEAVKQPEILVYPNPTTGVFQFSIENDIEKDLDVTIYNQAGQVCKKQIAKKTAGKFTDTVDISGLPNGLYIMEVGHGNDKSVKKIIKVN